MKSGPDEEGDDENEQFESDYMRGPGSRATKMRPMPRARKLPRTI